VGGICGKGAVFGWLKNKVCQSSAAIQGILIYTFILSTDYSHEEYRIQMDPHSNEMVDPDSDPGVKFAIKIQIYLT
jgi:hypothetical protein